ncbi:TrmO family methyltransferase [Streptomyces sp. NPDC046557]|uniref:TrmO family methyltransferase domain-containing protein n=1 Tax=Streptomyces sp. NPDC046557 TaxID=3155372 RepID=UPI0033CA6944
MVSDPVGRVVGGRTDVHDDAWEGVSAVIRLDGRFGPEALARAGLLLAPGSRLPLRPGPGRLGGDRGAHPRGNTDWPLVGIFARRGKNRPNLLGVSRCRLLRVDGLDVHVRGLDAVDGTPVLDIKPYMSGFGPRGATSRPERATQIMRRYC